MSDRDSRHKLASLIRSKTRKDFRCPRCWAVPFADLEAECPLCHNYGIVDAVPYSELLK